MCFRHLQGSHCEEGPERSTAHLDEGVKPLAGPFSGGLLSTAGIGTARSGLERASCQCVYGCMLAP